MAPRSFLHVLARYVHIPDRDERGRPLNYDLARSANPTHMDIAVEGIADQPEALRWFATQPEHSGACIFPLAQIDPADRANVRRAVRRRNEALIA